MIAIQHTLWGQFILVLLLSFISGMELKAYQQQFHSDDDDRSFGSIRTLTFTGILGFVFYLIHFYLFLLGFAALTAIYLLIYSQGLKNNQKSLLFFLVWSLVYSYGALAMNQPFWVMASVFVTVILVLNAKQSINAFAEKISGEEISTLAKLILLSAIILPLLSQQPLHTWIPVSPFKIWLAVVVVSAISYLGYVAQKYFFKEQGLLVTGVFGGLYSSTATTVVLAKKSKDNPRVGHKMTGAILTATGLMYLRLWAISAVFNWAVAVLLIPYLLGLAIVIFIIAMLFYRSNSQNHVQNSNANAITDEQKNLVNNPLELKVAFIFAGLFVVMSILTQLVTQHFGDAGLRYFSLFVGFTDIDPFVLSLLNGHYATDAPMLAGAILIAAGSNNLLKAIYAWGLSAPITGRYSAIALCCLGVVTIGLGWLVV